MIRVVVDTNVLVSSLWKKDGNPAAVVSQLLSLDKYKICYDDRIMAEYTIVLNRQEFGFEKSDIQTLQSHIAQKGLSLVVPRLDAPFVDKSDLKFYEVYKYSDAFLITGNLKHFPKENNIMNPATFLTSVMS